jgi:predicted AlkP superfamily phosphohydrolase/phosphomutase
VSEGAIGPADFLRQANLIQKEREAIFFSALDHTRRGVVACVFDTPDRVQQMFPGQPEIIEPLYCDMDRIVGKAMQHVDASTAIFVLSNHGVLFSNLKITADNPGIEDLAPTALSLFGVEAPAGMEGRAFFAPA